MFRIILPIILILGTLAIVITFIMPNYNGKGGVVELSARISELERLNKEAKELDDAQQQLTLKYNSISEDDRRRLTKLLPDNVDNIRLLIELSDVVASAYGMQLQDVVYDTSVKNSKDSAQASTPAPTDNNQYGTVSLGFSTEGSYEHFLQFLHALESNLRIVDVSSIEFSSASDSKDNKNSKEDYKYTFKIKTYWLKN